MKKTLLYITIPFVALIGATYILPRPAAQATSLTNIPSISSLASGASKTSENNDPRIQAEIKYYLDRHNVQDEGYEVVVGYIEGKVPGKTMHVRVQPSPSTRWDAPSLPSVRLTPS